MNGLSEDEILWPDAELESLNIDYDSVDILITDSLERKITISAKGFIGYKVLGFWDENIIDTGIFSKNHEFQKECLENLKYRMGDKLRESGCVDRTLSDLTTLEIKLIDGCSILIVAGKFVIASEK